MEENGHRLRDEREKESSSKVTLPLDLFGRLSNEESNRVGWKFGTSGVDRDLVVRTIVTFHLNSQEQELELHKA